MSSTAYTVFKTTAGGSPKNTPDSGTEKDLRSRQIDELVVLSENARREVYGPDADTDTANFYNLHERTRKSPTFRPHIMAPQLQMLLLADATDLTEGSVRICINHKKTGRDAAREKAFQEHWRQEFFNLQLLQAQVYANFSGTAWLQAGYDPLARRGEGVAWLRARAQKGVYSDSISPWPQDWSWQVIEDSIYLDEVRRRYPDHADAIRPRTARAEALVGPPAGGIEMPPGPMSVTVRGLPGGEQYTSDGVLRIRTLYARDATLMEPTDVMKAAFAKRGMPVPKSVPKYPTGRMIVDCEGTILVDGQAWLPLGEMWPAIPVWSIMPWDSVWCPSPVKYTRSLQDATERLMTQTYENAHRLNNGVWFIPEESGITADQFGGLPGEIVILSPNSQRMPEIKYPPPMPAQMIDLPMKYLQLQRELQGFSQARQGNPGAGNISADLFNSAVSESQPISRMRAKLFSYSVQKVAEIIFWTMCKFYKNPRTFYSNKYAQATPQVDPGSDQ